MINISIVIPVYNCKKYLSEAIESVIQWNPKDIEIILIDDGSKDGSELMCDEYAEKYQYISVAHIKNNGVSHARNVGIKNAKGKWVMFMDSDDMLLCSCEKLARIANKIDLDGIWFNYARESKNMTDLQKPITDVGSKTMLLATLDAPSYSCELCDILTLKPSTLLASWGKLFKREILNKYNILFNEELFLSEDMEFNIRYLLRTKRIACIDDNIYYYRDNENSVVRNFKLSYIQNREKLIYIIDKTLKNKDREIYQAGKTFCIQNLLQIEDKIVGQGKDYRTALESVLKTDMIRNYIKTVRKRNISLGKLDSMKNHIILVLWEKKMCIGAYIVAAIYQYAKHVLNKFN